MAGFSSPDLFLTVNGSSAAPPPTITGGFVGIHAFLGISGVGPATVTTVTTISGGRPSKIRRVPAVSYDGILSIPASSSDNELKLPSVVQGLEIKKRQIDETIAALMLLQRN